MNAVYWSIQLLGIFKLIKVETRGRFYNKIKIVRQTAQHSTDENMKCETWFYFFMNYIWNIYLYVKEVYPKPTVNTLSPFGFD